jgi:hypothetical protein
MESAGNGGRMTACAVVAEVLKAEVKGVESALELFSLTSAMHGHISRATCVTSRGEVAHQEGL